MGASPASGPASGRSTLCFQCYRAELERTRALKAAGELDTASEARFQTALPFEPVNRPRLAMLKVHRLEARADARRAQPFADRRHRAQIAARHALQQIAARLHVQGPARGDAERAMSSAVHAAELQLPEAWLPFVVSQ